MKISNNWVPAASDPACAPEFARYMDGSEGPQMIYGPRAITDALAAHLSRQRVVESEHDALLVLEELAVDSATLPPLARHACGSEAVIALYDNTEVPRTPVPCARTSTASKWGCASGSAPTRAGAPFPPA
jgi:hypothetical protein